VLLARDKRLTLRDETQILTEAWNYSITKWFMTVRTTIHALLPLLWYMFMTRAAWRQPVQASVDSMILRQHANFMRKYERLLKLDQNYCRI